MHRAFTLFIVSLIGFGCFASPIELVAQVQPVYDRGIVGTVQLLKRLNRNVSVMMIGAHPDDEDSALIAYLARGENARTAYLSLTRGDGGQNIIGPELFESLGVIRTEELLQARRLDGAEQYFTRAYDYGFSKTLEEAKQKWPEKIIVCDVVRAIRSFRPLVVISRFSGTPADGHGQHQYAGYISPIAVKAAGDAAQCTGSGPVWQVQKFYVEQGFAASSEPHLRINTGKYDPLLGRSYFEIAMEGRSQHRSQGEGRLELRGDQFSGLNLAESRLAGGQGSGLFDGLNIKPVITIPPGPGDLAMGPRDLDALLKLSSSNLVPNDARSDALAAVRLATGLQIDVLADRETVVAGDDLGIALKVHTHNAPTAKVRTVSWRSPPGWQITNSQPPPEGSAAFARRETADYTYYYNVRVPADAKITQPYWLQSRRQGDIFDLAGAQDPTLPFQPPMLTALVSMEIAGVEVTFEQRVQYRFADATRGEVRRDLNVVPAISVALDQPLLVVPVSARERNRRVSVTVTNNSSGPIKGSISLNSNDPRALSITPASNNFELEGKGKKAVIAFEVQVTRGTKTGQYALFADAIVGQHRFDQEMRIISYPHIQTHRVYSRAETKVILSDLSVAPANVGYVMGSGDEVPDAIRRMGQSVTMIEDLGAAELSRFDTIVVGIRASEVRSDLAANKQKLHDYMLNGGNLIVQYQRPTYAQQGLTPFPVSMNDTQRTSSGNTSRVVDENAKVTILDPAHPLMNSPNKITDADFEGWIQERNLYNFVTFDDRFVPLLESHDQGEQPNRGGLVVARIGKGTYVYTSYSFFRQLPAGVPGAYRIFANILSLPKDRAVEINP